MATKMKQKRGPKGRQSTGQALKNRRVCRVPTFQLRFGDSRLMVWIPGCDEAWTVALSFGACHRGAKDGMGHTTPHCGVPRHRSYLETLEIGVGNPSDPFGLDPKDSSFHTNAFKTPPTRMYSRFHTRRPHSRYYIISVVSALVTPLAKPVGVAWSDALTLVSTEVQRLQAQGYTGKNNPKGTPKHKSCGFS
ncbi:hypothetical protein Ddc_14497 [Ditylenchus destructor]|nr:hypothetical protein Ddc_14497 [Ditylenchus destructor]